MDSATIYACSTGAAPAAIAIVRVSGPMAFAVARALAGALPPPRTAALRALRHADDGRLLDRALVLVFPGPATATGEDLVEFHVHGGKAVVSAVCSAIASVPETRLAEAGEFTRRALANGVIDLTAAEGLSDLLAAETEAQRRAALRVAEGGLRAMIDDWTDRLVIIAARIEAQLDFSDEDDVHDETALALSADIATLRYEIERLLSVPAVERLRDGLRIVIAGPPNSGKSTLLNALAERDVAIVSPISGTTRDRIEAPVVRDGVAYVLTDTAGLTETPGDAIEAIGVARAKGAMGAADIVLWLGDDAPTDAIGNMVWVHARADLSDRTVVPQGRDVALSAATGAGLDLLWDHIARRAQALFPAEDTVLTNHRQRTLLAQSVRHLGDATSEDLLLVAEAVRLALRSLDAVAGRSGTEAVLDAIFSRFCIGK